MERATSLVREELIEDEVISIKNSGELPEIAYQSALYYLQHDPDGPKLRLSEEELHQLKNAVIHRFREIILRDLTPENKNKRIYRGILRAWTNLKRLKNFCEREGLCMEGLRGEISTHTLAFLEHELNEFKTTKRPSLNCSFETLAKMIDFLGVKVSIDCYKEICTHDEY